MLFYLFAFLILVALLGILFNRNILYAAFSLMLLFLGLAALYVLAGADFVAVAQIVVYVGGILILLIFGIMLTYSPENQVFRDIQPYTRRSNVVISALVTLCFGIGLAYQIGQHFSSSMPMGQKVTTTHTTSSYVIGMQFLTDYIVAFEAIALLLLIALIGATLIAGQAKDKESR